MEDLQYNENDSSNSQTIILFIVLCVQDKLVEVIETYLGSNCIFTENGQFHFCNSGLIYKYQM